MDWRSGDPPHQQTQLFKLKKMCYKTSLAERKLVNLLPDSFFFPGLMFSRDSLGVFCARDHRYKAASNLVGCFATEDIGKSKIIQVKKLIFENHFQNTEP